MGEKILIVEDEENIRSFVRLFLKKNGYDVIDTDSGIEALNLVVAHKPKLVVLDVMLPDIDGFKVCSEIRKHNDDVGVIMLTARSQDQDKIQGLETGADDYMVKPFNPKELLLRIKSILRRFNDEKAEDTIIHDGPFILNIYERKLYKNNEEIYVTPKEFTIMENFMKNPGKSFSREELLSEIWGWDFYGESKIVDVNIRRLRTKIEEMPSEPKYIETVWGKGYRWCNEKNDD
ncbi:DNA-binding response regulator, OmpR family, contains REC and winged-helix (wHTH) domain [Hathewaya proteolytica DSM 3090]|uniref:Stage 0 sporulation protein A homolog n=1 Tax=Hathewaya proteolytica DSM 3090 TaxID=1121331 RepID=A0A1M6Q8A5_9CLOT|nr:response regulator transcription factor [Hathewaya proteolytica]SHK16431.1 DNA-binding response regulator, OmpR family, contains REC and winged-helix (wHTH) domain [Hathewaya proteolytica DSM 3090]